MKKVFNLRIECNAPTFVMTDTEFCQALEEGMSDDFGEEMKYVKLKAEPCDKDQRIAELEEQLKNCIRPKFRTYQPIFYITQFYTSTNGTPEYDIISDKYYVSENENEIILGWNYANDFNRRKYYYVRKDWVFATKEEAEAKLKELEEQDVTNN